jgi:hypothetical protein
MLGPLTEGKDVVFWMRRSLQAESLVGAKQGKIGDGAFGAEWYQKANGRSKEPYESKSQAEILQTGGESSKLAVGVALG